MSGSRTRKDVISQAELRTGLELAMGGSPGNRFLQEIYMLALERRLAQGAVIEPGPLSFHNSLGVVVEKKSAGRETMLKTARLQRL
jgi:hypothetical protein